METVRKRIKWSALINPVMWDAPRIRLHLKNRRGVECVCALYSDLQGASDEPSQCINLPDSDQFTDPGGMDSLDGHGRDRTVIPPRVNMVALKNRIRAVQERDGFCTFLVERPCSLHHLTNPSCVAMKRDSSFDDFVMGDDAAEIGTREAFKYTHVKDKQRTTSIYLTHPQEPEIDLMTCEDDGEAATIRWYKKKKKRKLKIGKNPKEKAIPSDVKRGTILSKTSETSLRKLVTKFISKTFLTSSH
ncbi:hypothetical protein Y032_0005g2762 [Ancylostoma ceylanicum]|uniref:Uncharacterized protein n=1 Tax=Ancylostoma ceylanicum TaxID=53326 RepID=A0A016VTJ9_9BILA|nr:hypothetical protein Y032_0005g2762 [Ancylostoma ceylanicum]